MRFVGVIPSRYQSTRFPGKPLVRIAGKSLIEWVCRRAKQAQKLDEFWVATDDERIQSEVESFGEKSLLTRSDHSSGTDRVAEVAESLQADVFVNIQGDEPFISPHTIDRLCDAFESQAGLMISTARVRILDQNEIENPNVTKVVVDHRGDALYFSRSVIPYPRSPSAEHFKHIGIYAYRREFLLSLSQLTASPLEAAEGLEQLRFLQNGYPIRVIEVEEDSVGVDTPEDAERVRPLLENEAKRGGPRTSQNGR